MMKRSSILITATLGLLLFVRCAPANDCEALRTCLVDGGDEGGVVPAGCDAAADPKDAPSCVVDGFGVFVDAAAGSDSNAGTKAAPFKTIGGALAKLGAAKRVYVCEGTYAERVKVASPVSIYGGFACAGWGYTAEKAKIAPAEEGSAFEVDGVSEAVTFADLEIVAKDATKPGDSSIAAWVRGSRGVTFVRAVVRAGKGADGAPGAKGAPGALQSSTPMAGTLKGNDATGNGGAPSQTCTCVGGGTSTGGAGGSLGAAGSPGEIAQATPEPSNATGAGQTVSECSMSTAFPGVGSNAPAAIAASGASELGSLSTGAWMGASGAAGTFGPPAQGGGGGGGSGGGGGGGACGGCGGAGGSGGGGGGASAAVVVFDSPIEVRSSALVALSAGAGGGGGPGGDGQPGGNRGVGTGAACNGANGGRGGAGGAGGGGAGGISVGVLYKGPKPTLDATTITPGAPGAKGVGGAPGVNDGIAGISAETLEAP